VTVSAQTSFNSSTGNGVTTVFPYTFKILAAADLEVTVDGVVKTLTTHYTVSGAGEPAGGNVTFVTAPADGTTVIRRRNMALSRTTDYQTQGELRNDVLNDDQDAPVLMAQQIQEQVNRTLKLPLGAGTVDALPAAAARANKALIFDAEGDPTVSEDDYNDQAANAASSAATATAQATIATTKAAEATASASDAAAIATQFGDMATAIAAAQTAETNAETAETNAETAQAAAEAAEAQAEIYSSLAATGAKFFDTIALGNAGVADGATFGVKAGGSDGLTRATVYRRDSAGAQTKIGVVIPESEAEEFDVQRVQRRTVTVAGLTPASGTSQLANTVQLYRQPLPAGTLAKLEFYIQAVGDGTVDVVLFQRSRVTDLLHFTERDRITLTGVVAGLNTFLSDALTGLPVQEGDFIGLVRDGTSATPGYVLAGGLGVLRNASATPAADSAFTVQAAAGSGLQATVVADALESDSLGPALAASIAKSTAATDGTGELFTLGAPTVSAGTVVAGSTGGTFWYEHPVVRRSYLRGASVQTDIAGVGEIVVLNRRGTVNSAITTTVARFPVEFAAGLNTYDDETFQGYVLEPGDSVGVSVAGSTLRRDGNLLMSGSYIATGDLGTETTVWTSQTGPMFNWTVEPLRGDEVPSSARTAYEQTDFRTTTAPKDFLEAGGWTAEAAGLLSPVGTGAVTQRLTQRASHRTGKIIARWEAEAQGAGSKIAFGYDSATCVVDGVTGFFVVCNSGANSAAIPATYQQQALPVALASGKKFRVELISNRRHLTYKYTDLDTGQTLTTTEDYSAGTSITPTTGRMRGSAVAINLAGQTRILRFDQLSAQLRPTLAIIGDSITEQTGVTQDSGFPGLLNASLESVSIAGTAGGTSADYSHFVNDLLTQRPKAILSYFGTNDGDAGLASFSQNKNWLVAVCKAAGIQVGFGVVSPNNTGTTYGTLNTFLLALAADVKKIRFDYALTTNNDGVTWNASLFQDVNHPTAAGHAAMYARIQADWPELWDL
jgi:lysophospholipase L1-like esterase